MNATLASLLNRRAHRITITPEHAQIMMTALAAYEIAASGTAYATAIRRAVDAVTAALDESMALDTD